MVFQREFLQKAWFEVNRARARGRAGRVIPVRQPIGNVDDRRQSESCT